MIIILGLILAILVLIFGGLFVIGVSSILPDYVWFYIVWGYITVGIGAHIICFIADIFEDRALDKKMECRRCHGRCDKCVANKYRILHNLPAPQKNKELQYVMDYYSSTEVPKQYKCHVCGITLSYRISDENFEHICQLCYIQRKERNE